MFDEDPKDSVETHPCPNCENGVVKQRKDNHWECDTCDWTSEGED